MQKKKKKHNGLFQRKIPHPQRKFLPASSEEEGNHQKNPKFVKNVRKKEREGILTSYMGGVWIVSATNQSCIFNHKNAFVSDKLTGSCNIIHAQQPANKQWIC